MAVTRHIRLDASMTADSIVVWGIEALVRLSHEQTGVMPGKRAFGGVSADCKTTGAPARTRTRLKTNRWKRKAALRHWGFMTCHVLVELRAFDNCRLRA